MASKSTRLNAKANPLATKLPKLDIKPQNAKDFERESDEIISARYETTSGVVTLTAIAATILTSNSCQNSSTNMCNMAVNDHNTPARINIFFL
ncbi:unnamed protein product [marine sediment metagenome]|uniref:Uncharacterized protein n=1 Tax=marine sediment metagenome TaxID=412755 RepID=X1A7U2_9ZZZZ